MICEIGGTVGDIEGLPYIEALRQLSIEYGKAKTICIHLTYLPYMKTAEELKTKPTQHSVKQLQSMGIQPDILLCRSEKDIPEELRSKISMFCSVGKDNVIPALDAESIYLIPEQYHNSGLDLQICKHFQKSETSETIEIEKTWGALRPLILSPKNIIKIAVIGKYVKLKDAYLSLTQAIIHGGFANNASVQMEWVDAEDSFDSIESKLERVAGVLVPGGFSSRGTEGKIFAIKYARENDVPFLGICLGMQLAIIESCRNIAGVRDATSREFSENGEFVIDFMSNWNRGQGRETREVNGDKGGSMRLGSYPCIIRENSLAHQTYGLTHITERHRHRYEVNIHRYCDLFNRAGVLFSGMSEDGSLPEIMERADQRFFLGTQAHPEFKSKPFNPHPLFTGFVKAGLNVSK
jgi:CTP synthase